mmetsp:Transcript_42648/g.97829  ORF Transcript_42648/g.97829 Transcript_42648/m.97829 type:complete len:233 (+) Transcript_42648:979-1677(+)
MLAETHWRPAPGRRELSQGRRRSRPRWCLRSPANSAETMAAGRRLDRLRAIRPLDWSCATHPAPECRGGAGSRQRARSTDTASPSTTPATTHERRARGPARRAPAGSTACREAGDARSPPTASPPLPPRPPGQPSGCRRLVLGRWGGVCLDIAGGLHAASSRPQGYPRPSPARRRGACSPPAPPSSSMPPRRRRRVMPDRRREFSQCASSEAAERTGGTGLGAARRLGRAPA